MYPFTEGSFAVRKGWYGLAWTDEIGRGPMERWLLGDPVVLYRTEAGEAVAIGGRCPHWHFPLASGCLKGDSLVCGYHGLSFGPDGQCDHIPAQTHIPRSYRVRHYPVVEHWKWVFVWGGDPDLADPALLPTFEEIRLHEEGFVYRPFYVHEIKARYQPSNDNLLDLSHLAFLHGSTIGQLENSIALEIREQTPRRLSSRREMKGVSPAPAIRSKGYKGKVDRVSAMDFSFPGLHAGLDETRATSDDPERPGELLGAGRVYHAVTPATKHSRYYFFASGGMSEASLHQKYEMLKTPIADDIFASEEIERMLSALDEAPQELLLKSDTHAVLGRRLLHAMMDDEPAARADGPQLAFETGTA